MLRPVMEKADEGRREGNLPRLRIRGSSGKEGDHSPVDQ